MSVFQKMEDRRNEIGVTRKHIAQKLDLKDSVWQDWKQGKSTPNRVQLEIVASCLFTTVEYLLGETEQKEILSVSEKLSREEENLLKAWRAAENAKDFEVMDNTAWALRKYGMPMPEKNNTDQQSNSVIK